MNKTRLLSALIVAALAAPGAALAAGGESKVEDISFSFEGPFGSYDAQQLQRGFEVYHKVCKSCHGMKFLAFRELGREDGPSFPEDQVKAIAATYEVPNEAEPGTTRPGLPSDLFPANDDVGAPDLTLMAKARAGFHGPNGLLINQFIKGAGGPEYIYSILTGYTGKEKEIGFSILYENTAMPGGWISMAPPLTEDTAETYEIEYAAFGADGSKIGEGEGEAKDGDAHGSSYHPPEPTVEQMAKDLSAFLMFAAEPTMVERKAAGFRNLILIAILAVLLYYTNKKIWAPIKRNARREDD